ncbi:MAG: MBL fold metallo-hydrolase [Sphaerochaetaceae bacterium]|nr:MBL fold metallo-hydrolase [Sphaerochaetaceae bacterium]
MNITFFGAARMVTGSCTLVESGGTRILVDCGLPQGNDEKKVGMDFPFSPSSIDYILLTHAHIDHSGRIPMMVREGFHGTVHTTDATADLCSIMLSDSGHIQEMETEWVNRKRRRDGKSEIEPIYTVEDARNSMEYFIGHEYGRSFNLTEDIQVTFTDAGHILGSSSIQLHIREQGEERLIVFSGDIGNTDQPIINDPVFLKQADFVVMESTYGDRLHPPVEFASQQESTKSRALELASYIENTFKRGGNVIIPSFAVGRTQEILYLLRYIIDHRLIRGLDSFPVYLDSPLAIEATKVFGRNIIGYFDEEAMKIVEKGENPLRFPSLIMSVTADDSRAINFLKESAVIISASGMCEAGRIKHHLKHNLWRPESTVVFCGYQANGTLGRSILDGAKNVTIFGEHIDVKSQIVRLEGISGHADQKGLIRWVSSFSNRLKHVFVVHGDESVARFFAGYLQNVVEVNAWAPQINQSFDLLEEQSLPAAQSESVWIASQEQLKESITVLQQQMNALQTVIDRMKEHSDTVIEQQDSKKSRRLVNAITRLALEVEDLHSRWGG